MKNWLSFKVKMLGGHFEIQNKKAPILLFLGKNLDELLVFRFTWPKYS